MYFSSFSSATFFFSSFFFCCIVSQAKLCVIKHKNSDGDQKTIFVFFAVPHSWLDARQRQWELANNGSCTYYLIMNFNKRATAAARATATAAKCLMFIISTLWSNVWFLSIQFDGSWCRRFHSKKCSISGQPHHVIEDYFFCLVVFVGQKESYHRKIHLDLSRFMWY